MASSNDYLMVLEDDAVFEAGNNPVLDEALERAAGRPPGTYFYMDLAGGLSHRDLGVVELIGSRSEGMIEFTKPTTNTACAYLIDRPTAAKFLSMLDTKPWYRTLAIDWLLNMIMVDMTRHAERLACWHADPPVLGHGSFTGAFAPWQR